MFFHDGLRIFMPKGPATAQNSRAPLLTPIPYLICLILFTQRHGSADIIVPRYWQCDSTIEVSGELVVFAWSSFRDEFCPKNNQLEAVAEPWRRLNRLF